MEQPDLTGQGGGLYVEATVRVKFLFGEPLDEEMISAEFSNAKQMLLSMEGSWRNNHFEDIMDFYRNHCGMNKSMLSGRTAREIEEVEG
jgi:hypothetical protein